MDDEMYRRPVSDPEAEGIPEYADDDSTAYTDVESGREADGYDPAALPADHPLAVDRFGTTPAEARQGESLDMRLAEEEPDVTPPTSAADEERVGRLVEPDEGAHSDEETDAVAYDAGFAGGGESAEESAIHEIPEEEQT